MTELFIKAAPAIISAVCLGLMSWMARKITAKVAEITKDFSVLKQAQQDQLKAAIVDKYEIVQERGFITPMSLETVNRMADSYFALGGNHYIHALMNHMNEGMLVKGVPIPTEKEQPNDKKVQGMVR